jgi:cytochrome bd-type quinol oxidase subunit 2
MMVFRFIAVVLIVLGLMMLGADLVTMLERGGEPHIRTIGDVWALFSATGYETFSLWVSTGLPKPVADGVTTVLGLQAFAAFLVLGVVMAVLFRQSADAHE